jgi:glycosyltransferase involved in cell wall biosynthesis
MKVLHVINTLSAGGAELHLLTLCRYLKRQGAELVVACLKEHVRGSRSLVADFENENIRVINLDADSRYNLSFLGRLLRLVKNERPDILHTHLPRADIAGALAFRLASPPAFVCSVHGIYHDRWFGPWSAPLMRCAYREADAVIAISAAVKNWLHQDLGIRGDKVKVIHYGIETNRFTRCNAVKNLNGKTNGQAVVGSIGRLEPGKGFDCLIRAMQEVRQQVPNASLSIAGHDPLGYGNELAGLIVRLSLKDHVQLVGFQRDVASFLHATDVFAFASRSEGFGQVVIEAMAAGKPVVVSRIPSLTEIVKDGETGLLIEPGQPEHFARAITWLLMHRKEAEELGRRGQTCVQDHFSADKMARETVSLYDQLVGSSRCTGSVERANRFEGR